MQRYSLSHLADHVLVRDLAAIVARDRETTATLLAHLAEVDARKLYLPAAYPSMFAYCVGELGLSEDAAFRRIRAARTARQFPALFAALADGRLSLSAVLLLAPHLTPENADELLGAATHKRKAELERLLAERFPQPDVATLVQALPTPAAAPQLAPAPVSEHVNPLPPTPVAPRPKVTPLAPERFALQLTISQRAHDNLRYAQAMLGHAVPSGDLAQVLERALEVLVEKLEQRRFAATSRSRPRRGTPKGRIIPAAVRREVWHRDGGQCTFVSDKGHRCEARSRLELDHVIPVSRGGEASAANLRLRCRAHNQFAAECTYGAGFVQRKREAARARSTAPAPDADVIKSLRALGFRPDEVQRGVAAGASRPEASLEQRVRLALSTLAPKAVKRGPAPFPIAMIPVNSARRAPAGPAILLGHP